MGDYQGLHAQRSAFWFRSIKRYIEWWSKPEVQAPERGTDMERMAIRASRAWSDELLPKVARDSEWGEPVFWSMKRLIAALMLAGDTEPASCMLFMANS